MDLPTLITKVKGMWPTAKVTHESLGPVTEILLDRYEDAEIDGALYAHRRDEPDIGTPKWKEIYRILRDTRRLEYQENASDLQAFILKIRDHNDWAYDGMPDQEVWRQYLAGLANHNGQKMAREFAESWRVMLHTANQTIPHWLDQGMMIV